MTLNRRQLLQRGGGLALTFATASGPLLLTPAQARERDVALTMLAPDEVATLERFGNVVHPDAAASGLAHFIDHQLAADPNEALLIAKAFNVALPYADFYRAGLGAVNAWSKLRHDKPFADVGDDVALEMVRALGAGALDGWDGPPAPLWYIVMHCDVVDVVYGTVDGFKRLGIPYMPHILPEQRW